jgi:hypothetical protein
MFCEECNKFKHRERVRELEEDLIITALVERLIIVNRFACEHCGCGCCDGCPVIDSRNVATVVLQALRENEQTITETAQGLLYDEHKREV